MPQESRSRLLYKVLFNLIIIRLRSTYFCIVMWHCSAIAHAATLWYYSQKVCWCALTVILVQADRCLKTPLRARPWRDAMATPAADSAKTTTRCPHYVCCLSILCGWVMRRVVIVSSGAPWPRKGRSTLCAQPDYYQVVRTHQWHASRALFEGGAGRVLQCRALHVHGWLRCLEIVCRHGGTWIFY